MRNFLPNFTKRQWLTLIIIGLADFCNAICVSLQAPFFPQEASVIEINSTTLLLSNTLFMQSTAATRMLTKRTMKLNFDID